MSILAYELSLIIVADIHIKFPPLDIKISATISTILNDFSFKNPLSFLVFHVATKDGKESARQRKFSEWFEKYNNSKFEKYVSIIFDSETSIYISVIFRNNNPYKIDILSKFYQLIKEANSSK